MCHEFSFFPFLPLIDWFSSSRTTLSHTCLMCNFSACFSPSRTCHSINYMNTKHNYTLLKSKHKFYRITTETRAESLLNWCQSRACKLYNTKKLNGNHDSQTPIIHHHICDTCEKWFALVALWNCLFLLPLPRFEILID